MPEPAINATIYAATSYTGAAQNLYAGRYDLGNLSIGGRQLSSLRVTQGWRVTLYQDAGFAGPALVCTDDTVSVGSFFRDATHWAASPPPIASSPVAKSLGAPCKLLEGELKLLVVA